jgi:DegV family protein with EDD domain
MKIITDSTADLTHEVYTENEIGLVPLTIHLGEKTWRDFYDVQPEEFYSLLRNSKAFPTTSQPSPQDFIAAFEPFVAKREPVLSIHLSSKLSGTYQSALLAKSHFPEAQIEVVDSLQASLGLALIILLCVYQRQTGASFEEVSRYARGLTQRVRTYFSVDSLDHLQKGGRIGKAQALLGTLMKVKPLLSLNDGEVLASEKIRTTERLLNRFADLVSDAARGGKTVYLTTGEAHNAETMKDLHARLTAIPGVKLIFGCKLGGVITSHAGPGALAISFVQETIIGG